MEQNFNPNQGDYKYILEEEQRKESGEAQPSSENQHKKTSLFDRFWNFTIIQKIKYPSKSEGICTTFYSIVLLT